MTEIRSMAENRAGERQEKRRFGDGGNLGRPPANGAGGLSGAAGPRRWTDRNRARSLLSRFHAETALSGRRAQRLACGDPMVVGWVAWGRWLSTERAVRESLVSG